MGRLAVSLLAVPLALAAVGLATRVLGVGAFPANGQDRSYLFPIQITAVDARVDDAGQVALDVEGIIPSGCAQFEQVVQSREENWISVQVLARHSGAEICTMIAQIYRETILLDDALPPGAYIVDVNGVTRELEVS